MNSKAELRRYILKQREALRPEQRLPMDRRVCAHLLRYFDAREELRIAGFAAFRGEPDTSPALDALHQAGHSIYLPVIDAATRTMRFGRWIPGAQMDANGLGISEPTSDETCPPEQLDVVLCPLVAYAPGGTRLGMGAGYYDRCFAFTQDGAGPLLLGVAYSLQETDSLPAEHWDVPLTGVVTERGFREFI